MFNPRTIAVSSGKGGVGKTSVALNLALALGRRGQRVLLVDGDMGLGNVALLAGVSSKNTVEDVLCCRCDIEEAVVEGPEGLSILPAGSDPAAASAVGGFWDGAKLEQLNAFERSFDLVLVDTGAGIGAAVLDFATAAAEVLLLVAPESAAVADSYALFKAVLSRRPDLRGHLLVSMASGRTEGEEVQRKFRLIVERFLGAEIADQGYIPLDRNVREAALCQIPFMLASPPPPAAAAIERLADGVLEGEEAARGGGLFEQVVKQWCAVELLAPN